MGGGSGGGGNGGRSGGGSGDAGQPGEVVREANLANLMSSPMKTQPPAKLNEKNTYPEGMQIGKKTGWRGEPNNVVNVTLEGKSGDKVNRNYKMYGSYKNVVERDIKTHVQTGAIKSVKVNSIKKIEGSASFADLRRPGEG